MKKSSRKKISLGALVAALFEEARKVTRNRLEQNFLVSTALKDLLRHNRNHLMVVKA